MGNATKDDASTQSGARGLGVTHDQVHDQVRAQFSKTAAAYVRSEGHAKGAELMTMVRLGGDLAGKEVLDVATGGGHTALAFARARV